VFGIKVLLCDRVGML